MGTPLNGNSNNTDPVGTPGVFGTSEIFNGVRGITSAEFHGAVVGISANRSDKAGPGVYGASKGTAIWGESETWMGVFGKTKSSTGGAGVHGFAEENNGAGVYGLSAKGPGVIGESTAAPGVIGHSKQGAGVVASSDTNEAIHAETKSTTTAAIAAIQTNRDSKSAALYARHDGNGPAAVFAGNVHVHGDVLLMNADIAEDFTVAEPEVEAGSVMIFDKEGLLVPCNTPYDKKVVGVISGAGQYKPGMILDKQDEVENRHPIALMGKVYCKVDATICPIEIGDLLTTSPTKGAAMKAVDPYKSFGTVIGKALKPLASGHGLIPILVTLQ